MSEVRTTRSINAPVDIVFATLAEVDNFSKAVPHITKVEMLSDIRSGVGTRFRETRIMKGREASTELEITEYVANDHVRFVSDAGGTIWDTVFTVKPEGDGTHMEMVMAVKAYKFLAKIFNPLIMGMVRKAIEADMDAVKAYCEQQ